MWYFHLTRYKKLNILPPTLQQSVSYSSHPPMILLFMISQGRGSQSNSLTILETKARINRKGLMACGHRLQSGSKNPQDIPLISKVVEQRLRVCLFLQPRNAARTHKHIQELGHMQIAPGIKTKMHRQSSLSPSQAPGKPAPSTLQVPLDSPGVARLPAKSRGCLNSAPRVLLCLRHEQAPQPRHPKKTQLLPRKQKSL